LSPRDPIEPTRSTLARRGECTVLPNRSSSPQVHNRPSTSLAVPPRYRRSGLDGRSWLFPRPSSTSHYRCAYRSGTCRRRRPHREGRPQACAQSKARLRHAVCARPMRNASTFSRLLRTNTSMACSMCARRRRHTHTLLAQNLEVRSRSGATSAEVRSRSNSAVDVHNEIRTATGPHARPRKLQPGRAATWRLCTRNGFTFALDGITQFAMSVAPLDVSSVCFSYGNCWLGKGDEPSH
jgi:hypothetical protein